jgi:nucleotide-binding universal stress UspA family protein
MPERDTGRVVVGISATLAGYQALRYAIAEACERNARLSAVRAFRSPGAGGGAQWRDALVEAATKDVCDVFDGAVGGAPPDVPMTVVVRIGEPGRILVAIANRPDDLLIIGGCGARRLGWVRRAAVARYCAREALCPVIMTPPPQMAGHRSESRLAKSAAHSAQLLLHGAAGGE